MRWCHSQREKSARKCCTRIWSTRQQLMQISFRSLINFQSYCNPFRTSSPQSEVKVHQKEWSSHIVPTKGSLQRIPLQLDKYDGSNIPYETFRAKLAICAEYNQWSEEAQLAHLQSSLTNAAAQCLWDVGFEKANHLSAILDLLQLRFGSDNQRERYRVELRTRHQKPGESLTGCLSGYSSVIDAGISWAIHGDNRNNRPRCISGQFGRSRNRT
jgi:hypothetical protein